MPRGKDTSHSPRRKVGRLETMLDPSPFNRATTARDREYNRRASDWDKWNDVSPMPDPDAGVGWGTHPVESGDIRHDLAHGNWAHWLPQYRSDGIGSGLKGPAAKATGRI